MVLALVEKAAGLLALPERGPVAHHALADHHRLRDLAGEDSRFGSQTFPLAGGGVVAGENALYAGYRF